MLEPGHSNVLSLDDVSQSMHMSHPFLHTITLRNGSPDRPVNLYRGRGDRGPPGLEGRRKRSKMYEKGLTHLIRVPGPQQYWYYLL